MEFTTRDLGILISMSLAVIMISFVFPTIGLAESGDKAAASEIPEFNISAERFDFAGDFPDNPGTPSTGVLERNEAELDIYLPRFFHGDTAGGVRMTTENVGTLENPDIQVCLEEFDTEGFNADNCGSGLTEEGDRLVIEDFEYNVVFELESLDNVGSSDLTSVVSYEIRDRPSDESWITGIPIVGGVYSAGEVVGQTLLWGFSIIWWGITWLFEITANLLGVLLDVTVFFITLLHWLLSTYSSVISGANSWAGVLVAIPGLILGLMLAKLVMIGIKLLPTT